MGAGEQEEGKKARKAKGTGKRHAAQDTNTHEIQFIAAFEMVRRMPSIEGRHHEQYPTSHDALGFLSVAFLWKKGRKYVKNLRVALYPTCNLDVRHGIVRCFTLGVPTLRA